MCHEPRHGQSHRRKSAQSRNCEVARRVERSSRTGNQDRPGKDTSLGRDSLPESHQVMQRVPITDLVAESWLSGTMKSAPDPAPEEGFGAWGFAPRLAHDERPRNLAFRLRSLRLLVRRH
jgi:hypothetical protein